MVPLKKEEEKKNVKRNTFFFISSREKKRMFGDNYKHYGISVGIVNNCIYGRDISLSNILFKGIIK